MHQLMSKIEKLQEETGDGPQPGRGGLRGGDEFKRLKAHIAQDIREIRLQLKQRDALMQKGASGTKQTAQLSHSIREQLKAARDDANRLKDLHRKGKGGAGEREERGEVVELVFKHIDEVEALDKRRHTSKASASRAELFSGGGEKGTPVAPVQRLPVGDTELPDIETQEGLRQLQQTDQHIDAELAQVAAGVADLKTVALDVRDEVQVQAAMVDEITSKVDKANRHLVNINKKMKKTLQSTRSADRFIVDFICLVILMGIIGYIISMVT